MNHHEIGRVSLTMLRTVVTRQIEPFTLNVAYCVSIYKFNSANGATNLKWIVLSVSITSILSRLVLAVFNRLLSRWINEAAD